MSYEASDTIPNSGEYVEEFHTEDTSDECLGGYEPLEKDHPFQSNDPDLVLDGGENENHSFDAEEEIVDENGGGLFPEPSDDAPLNFEDDDVEVMGEANELAQLSEPTPPPEPIIEIDVDSGLMTSAAPDPEPEFQSQPAHDPPVTVKDEVHEYVPEFLQQKVNPTVAVEQAEEPEEPAIGGITVLDSEWSNPVLELIYWRRPLRSSLVLAALLVFQFGLICCSIISVIAYTGLSLLLTTAGLKAYGHFFRSSESGCVLRNYLESDVTISRERTEEVTRRVLDKINAWVLVARDLFLITSFFESLKLAVVLYILTYIGARFNFLTLCILSTVAVFALPKFYETNKDTIDKLMAIIKKKLRDLVNAGKAKVEQLPFFRHKKIN